jgi:glucose/arabinose dehydrogenase
MKLRFDIILPLVCLALGAGACGGDDDDETANPLGVESELVASAPTPVALAFAPDGRLFFAEKFTGNIRIVDASGSLLDQPFAHLDVAEWLNQDWGLTGLAFDPGYATNHYVYAFYSEVFTASGTAPVARPVLIRFTDQDNQGTDQTVIIGDFPPTRDGHQGFKANGAIHFGPDGALYMTLGDYDWNKEGPTGIGVGQDLSLPMGKVLRVDASGQALPDNPFVGDASADPRIFAYGFSHGWPFAFQPTSGGLYTVDATDSCEELNIVVAAGNYGWPDVGEFPFSDCYFGDQVDAIYLFAKEGSQPGSFQSGPLVSGLAFLSGSKYATLSDGLLVCEAQTSLMRRLVLSGPNFDQVTANDVVVDDCQADVIVAPDGTIYYSNMAEIRKLNPPAATATGPTS